MDIDGGGKTRKSKRRKSKRNKSKRKQRRKSKKRKSKRKTYRKRIKRNKIGGFELPPGYESCEGCKCIRKIDNDDNDEIFPDPGRGPPPFPDMGAVRINNNNDDNIYYEYDNNNNNPGDNDKPPF